MKELARDFRLGVGLILFCIILLLFIIPSQVGPLNEDASFMPVLITTVLLFLSLYLCIISLGKRDKIPKAEKPSGEMRGGVVVAVSFTMIIYSWLFETMGFVAISLVSMLTLFRIFGIRNLKKTLTISIITLTFLYFSFEKLFNAPLPVGRIFEKLLN